MLTQRILTCATAIVSTLAVHGADPVVFKTDNGLYFWLHSPEEAAVVNPLAIVGNEDIYEGDIVIPASVVHNGVSYPVTAIAKQAFENYAITSVTIPPTIKSMGENAFAGCDELSSVNISDLAAWCMIDFNNSYSSPLFYGRHLFLNGAEADEIVIPESVRSIGEYTFKKCLSLTSVDFGSGVTSVAPNAFYGCDNITDVTIGDNVTDLGESAFWMCASLQNVNGGNGLESVGRRPFEYTPWEQSQPDGPVYLGEHVLYTYKGTPATSSYTIPASVTVIAGDALYNCKELTSISFPDGLKWIGSYAFHECSGLETATFKAIEHLGNNAFFRCTSLKGVELGTQINRIDDSTFAGCTSLRSIKIPDTVSSIGTSAFRECSSLRTATIGTGVATIGQAAFTGCSALRKIDLPDNVVAVDAAAFAGCTNLSTVIIGAGMESIGYSAFYDCSNLSSVTIANSSTPLQLSYNSRPYGKPEGEGLFQAGSLIEIYLGRDLQFESSAECGYTPFNSQQFLETVTLGPQVTELSANLFKDCNGIYTVNVNAATPPAAPSTAPYPFTESTFTRATLTVPEASASLYAEAPCWREFLKINGSSAVIGNVAASSAANRPFALNGRTVSATANSQILILTPDGKRLNTTSATTAELPCAGIYIVVADGKAFKIAVE